MNSKNKRFFDRRIIGYPKTVRFERIPSNVTASEKKKVEKTCSVFQFKKKRIKRHKNGYFYKVELTSLDGFVLDFKSKFWFKLRCFIKQKDFQISEKAALFDFLS